LALSTFSIFFRQIALSLLSGNFDVPIQCGVFFVSLFFVILIFPDFSSNCVIFG